MARILDRNRTFMSHRLTKNNKNLSPSPMIPSSFNSPPLVGEDKGGGFYYSPPIKGGEITSPLAGEGWGEGELMQKFEEAMNDDFNAAQAIGYLNTELHHLNSIRSKSSEFLKGVANIRKIGDVLGFFGQNPYEYFEREKSEGLASIGISEDEIKRLISEREMARKEKKG